MSVLLLLAAAPVLALLILAYDWLKERWARRDRPVQAWKVLRTLRSPTALTRVTQRRGLLLTAWRFLFRRPSVT
jgi:hypothetical protein